jgi:uncharacterized protein
MISRNDFVSDLHAALKRSRITALIGPRQSGKTTLARAIYRESGESGGAFFDLEDPAMLARLAQPLLALEPLRGLVVIDEVQRMPELFPLLRVLADREGTPATFLILCSASPSLIRDASESLAGRIEFIELGPFDMTEVGVEDWRRLWFRGGMPLSFLAGSDRDSLAWREGFIRTFLERDIPELGTRVPSTTLRRFWTMLAHYHGQIWNASEFGRSFGVSEHAVRRHLDLLTGTFVVRQLLPWHENIGKRQVKSPKVFLSDSGLLHSLLGLGTPESLSSHPKLGASWEGFALEQVIRVLRLTSREAFFWATHSGAELDLLVLRNGRRWGFEFKYADAPKLTRSMRSAREDLKLERLWVVHPGKAPYPLASTVEVIPIEDLPGVRDRVA